MLPNGRCESSLGHTRSLEEVHVLDTRQCCRVSMLSHRSQQAELQTGFEIVEDQVLG